MWVPNRDTVWAPHKDTVWNLQGSHIVFKTTPKKIKGFANAAADPLKANRGNRASRAPGYQKSVHAIL